MERKDIINNKKTGWLNLNEVEKKNVFEFSEGYMDFLNKSKTEREFAKNAKELLDNNGFINIEEKSTLNIGDKVNTLFKLKEKETTPPKHYTIETLNNYLMNPFKEDKKE